MCQRLGVNNFDMASIREKTNTSVKNGLKDTFAKVDITIDTTNNCIYYGSLFDIAYKNKKDDYEVSAINYAGIDSQIAALGDGKDASPLDVANMIAALHEAVPAYGQQDIEYSSDHFDSSSVSGTTTLHAELTARNIGASIVNPSLDNQTKMANLKSRIGITSDLEIHQIMMVNMASTTYVQENSDILTSLSNTLPDTGTYIVATFDAETSGFAYQSTLLPSKLYLSAAVDSSDGTVHVGYNNLSARDLAVLKAIAGKDAGAFNTSSVATSMTNYLHDLVLFQKDLVTVTLGMVLGQEGAGTIVEDHTDGADSARIIRGKYEINYSLI